MKSYHIKRVCKTTCILLLITLLYSVNIIADPQDTYDVGNHLFDTYKTIRTIGTLLGGFSIAANGIHIMAGGAKAAEKAYKHILYSLIAVAALWVLPSIVKIGVSAMGSGWSPDKYQS